MPDTQSLTRDSYHVNSVCVRRHRNNDALRANFLAGPETAIERARPNKSLDASGGSASRNQLGARRCFGSRRRVNSTVRRQRASSDGAPYLVLARQQKPVLPQLAALGVELDQRMRAAFNWRAFRRERPMPSFSSALSPEFLVTRYITINEENSPVVSFSTARHPISPDHCTPNYRLFRILQRAMNSSKERPKTLGTNQFLRAVIADNEELGDDYYFRGHIPDMLAESNGHPIPLYSRRCRSAAHHRLEAERSRLTTFSTS